MVVIPWFRSDDVFVLARCAGGEEWNFLVLSCTWENKKFVVKALKSTDDLSQVMILAKSAPVTLCLAGKGVLERATDSKELFQDDIVSRFLPNANASEFSWQVYDSNDVNGYVINIARIDFVNGILNRFASQGIIAGQLLLGETVGKHEVNEAQWMALKTSNGLESILDQEQIQSDYGILKSMAQNQRNLSWKMSALNVSSAKTQAEEFRYFSWTKKVLLIVPAIVLVILIANLLYYDHLEQQFVSASAVIEANRSELDSITELETLLTERAKVLGDENGMASIPASYYSDQIGASVPGAIVLNKLDIFPIIYDEESNKAISMRYDSIWVNGTAKNSEALNSWIADMNKMDWLKAVNILNYEQNDIQEPAEFELMLTTK